MSDAWLLRLGILAAGALLLLAIVFFGRPRKEKQGRRVEPRNDGDRREPTLGQQVEAGLAHLRDAPDAGEQGEMPLGAPPATLTSGSDLGRRGNEDFDKIVTLYVAARAGQLLRGPDIVVAAEKAGLTYGHMNVFHRLVDGRPERGPVFSVANVKKPGGFDLDGIQMLETPAIAFVLTLPAPVSALDAWDMLQPAAQRMAELLDGVLLDESRNALGRQRVQHIREELRAYDRQHEAPPITRSPRW